MINDKRGGPADVSAQEVGGYLMPPELRDDLVRKVSEMDLVLIQATHQEARRNLADVPRGVVDRVLLRLGLVRKTACLDLLAGTIAQKNAKISEVRLRARPTTPGGRGGSGAKRE